MTTIQNPTVNKLMTDHDKLIRLEASKYSTHVPSTVVLSKAYQLARKAAESFEPGKGNKFSTHLVNSLKKLSRISTTYGSMLRLPENKQFDLQKLNVAEEELRGELGREPNVTEISDYTGMPAQLVTRLRKGRHKEVNVANLVVNPTFVDSQNDEWVRFVYHDLAPTDKLIMEYLTGMSGKPVLTKEEIAKKVNLSYPTVCQRVRMISDQLDKGWKEGL